MDDWITYGELKILEYVWVQVHDVYILEFYFLAPYNEDARPQYNVSRAHSGLCLTTGCVSSSGF